MKPPLPHFESLAALIEHLSITTQLVFYGELDDILPTAMAIVLKMKDLKIFTDGSDIPPEIGMTQLEYWLVLSLLLELDCIEYGTSPRGAWLTDTGEVLLTNLQELLP